MGTIRIERGLGVVAIRLIGGKIQVKIEQCLLGDAGGIINDAAVKRLHRLILLMLGDECASRRDQRAQLDLCGWGVRPHRRFAFGVALSGGVCDLRAEVVERRLKLSAIAGQCRIEEADLGIQIEMHAERVL